MILETLLHNPIFAGGLGIGMVGGALACLRSVPTILMSQVKRQLSVSITVTNDDIRLFDWFSFWLESHPYGRAAREVSAVVHQVTRDDDEDGERKLKVIFSPAPGYHFFVYKNRLVWMHKEREKAQNGVGSYNRSQETITLRMLGRSQAILRDLCEEVQSYAMNSYAKKGVAIFVNSSGRWNFVVRKKPRALSTVILPEGMTNELVSEIEEFKKRESWYNDMGIPHRRGYLLHGPPGNGKSSLVAALAGHLNMDLHLLTLSNPKLNDEDLVDLFQSLPKNSLLLLEDVDSLFVEREKTDDGGGLSFSGLLNALDGVASKDGVVLFMTTNHVDRLDPALIRPGRADQQLAIDNASNYQLHRLYMQFYPNDPGYEVSKWREDITKDGPVSMAQAQEALMKGFVSC